MKMKLSQFETGKKIIFVNGIPEKLDSQLNGEVQFSELTKDKIIEIKDAIIDKLDEKYTEEHFVYEIISYISDLEVDISEERFNKLVKSPTVQFSYIYEGIVDVINNLFELAGRTTTLNDKVNKINAMMPKVEETVEQKIIRITKEMENEKDMLKKKVLFKELSKLYNEIGE